MSKFQEGDKEGNVNNQRARMPLKSEEDNILAKGGDTYMTILILILINGYFFLLRVCYLLGTVLSTKISMHNIWFSQQLCVVGITICKETQAWGSCLPKGTWLGFSPSLSVCLGWGNGTSSVREVSTKACPARLKTPCSEEPLQKDMQKRVLNVCFCHKNRGKYRKWEIIIMAVFPSS